LKSAHSPGQPPSSTLLDAGEQFLVNTAVLCELAWVLATA
jgi:hypothetical protein